MNFQTKKYKEYLAQDYRPVMLSEMPFVVDHRALRDYARSKGVAIASLSDEEKKQFLRPNPEYTAATVHPLITFAKNAFKVPLIRRSGRQG